VDATNPGSKTFSVLSLAGVKVHVFAPLGELFDDACHATLGAIKLLIECFFGRDSYSFVFFFFTAKSVFERTFYELIKKAEPHGELSVSLNTLFENFLLFFTR
jgi:hypothetical protein